ncbi:MAG: hypothetical protein IPP91_12610 [Betaproteobacteria bacterium]|nr:hypothetical protein [Betaproteobacteria bacterium]
MSAGTAQLATTQDNQGHTTTLASARFVVNASGSTPPTGVAITAPLVGASFISPETISMTATATPASGKTISSVSFYAGANVVAVANASPYTAPWTNTQPGAYSLMALATDSAGGLTLSAPVSVTVSAPQPPVVSITTPADGATFTSPATIALAATATAAGTATIAKVEFFDGATLVGSANAAPFAFTWTNVAAGTYAITAKATDSRAATATSAPVSLTVAAGPPPPPALAIAAAPGLDGSTVNEKTMLVNGTITAPANSGVTVNGMLATVGTGGEFALNEVPLSAGANTITLTVTTQDGNTASQVITVASSGAAAPSR